jgi:hypothetical protein
MDRDWSSDVCSSDLALYQDFEVFFHRRLFGLKVQTGTRVRLKF